MLQLEMLLNPGIFSEIRLEVMKELHKHLLICDDSVTSEQLQTKLQTFGQHLTITCSSRMIMTVTLNKIGEFFKLQIWYTDCPLCTLLQGATPVELLNCCSNVTRASGLPGLQATS